MVTPQKASKLDTSTATAADGSTLPPLPKDHLDHPEQWATGDEPATEKQKGFIKVLEGKNQDLVPSSGLDLDGMGKSEASEVIDSLKNGKAVSDNHDSVNEKKGDGGASNKSEDDKAAEASKIHKTETVESEKADEDDASESKAANDDSVDSKKRKTTHDSASGSTDQDKAASSNKDGDVTMTGEKADDDTPTASDEKKANKTDDSLESATAGNDEKEKDDEGHVEKKPKTDTTAKGEQAQSSEGTSTDKEGPATTTESAKPNGTNGTNGNGNGHTDETVPGDGEHLDHPENWATGDEPATEKQKGFVALLEKKAGVTVGDKDSMGKSEASEVIEELKNKTN